MVEVGKQGVTRVDFVNSKKGSPIKSEGHRIESALASYFGSGRDLRVKVDWSEVGSDFSRDVLLATAAIPFGETATYGEIAKKIGRPQAARAVGRALGTNPFCLFVPCHRVVGSDGSLTGFGAGIWRKKWLLEHEQKAKSSS
jgi:O-6-methylguanine DNA methyltransferase